MLFDLTVVADAAILVYVPLRTSSKAIETQSGQLRTGCVNKDLVGTIDRAAHLLIFIFFSARDHGSDLI